MFNDTQVQVFVATLIYVALGVVTFGIAFWAVTRISPFSVRREIEEDQNVALAIIIGSVILGLAIIIASAISG